MKAIQKKRVSMPDTPHLNTGLILRSEDRARRMFKHPMYAVGGGDEKRKESDKL